MKTFEGRADYGDCTTVSMIEELADMLDKAEKLDAKIMRRLKPDQHKDYEAAFPIEYPDMRKLRKFADDWQARLDAEEGQ
jgi:hypothetical protein